VRSEDLDDPGQKKQGNLWDEDSELDPVGSRPEQSEMARRNGLLEMNPFRKEGLDGRGHIDARIMMPREALWVI
jgi:hypothetical protein